MSVNPAFQAMLDAMAAAPAIDYDAVPAAELRALYDVPMTQSEPIALARVEDICIPLAGRTLAARLYVPREHAAPSPGVVYFHGGGWMIGTLDTHDATCRALARASGARIVSVEYRLAPEHAYPAAALDAYESLAWIAANAGALGLDPRRLAVAGDSAGGNLAAAAAIQARDLGGPNLAAQLLVYPVADADFTTPSYLASGGGDYFLSTAVMRRFWRDYLGEVSSAAAPLAAILRHSDLGRLPPATVIVAEHDPLRDEGAAYAARLTASGVETELWQAEGMIHGFFSMFEIAPEASAWVERAGARLAERLAA